MSLLFKTMIDMEKSAYFIAAQIQGESRSRLIRASMLGNGDMVMYPVTKELLWAVFGKSNVSVSDKEGNTFRVYPKQKFLDYSSLEVSSISAITLIKRDWIMSISLLNEINYHQEPIVV